MNAIFLGEERQINEVFSPETRQALKRYVQLENTVYTGQDITGGNVSAAGVEFIFSTWGMPCFTEDEVKRYFPDLKAVFYAAGSVQAFARPFLNNGIKVYSAWAANAVPVAEYTVAQIILANKGFYSASRIAKSGDWAMAREVFGKYPGNYGAKIGIIGAGMIGKLVIKMLKSYNLTIMAFDPFLPDETAKQLGVEKVSLEEIFTQCDVISNHLANNEQTRRMLTGSLFQRMRANATFINTGRGTQLVAEDLIAVLRQRPDIVALLDVTDPEPLERDSEFYTLDNCVLTPHIAGSFGKEVHRMSECRH